MSTQGAEGAEVFVNDAGPDARHFKNKPAEFRDALDTLRDAFGPEVGWLAMNWEVEIERQLAAIVPGASVRRIQGRAPEATVRTSLGVGSRLVVPQPVLLTGPRLAHGACSARTVPGLPSGNSTHQQQHAFHRLKPEHGSN